MFRKRRKAYNLKNFDRNDEPLSVTRLAGASKLVRRLLFLPELHFVVAASYDNSVRVYSVNTPGEPYVVFNHHTDRVNDLQHLHNDVVVSVGFDNRLFAWKAANAELVGEWEHNAMLWSVAKLGESKILIGDDDGNLTVLVHESATSFEDHRVLQNSHSHGVWGIAVHGNFFLTCSGDETFKIWNKDSLALVATLPHFVFSVAVSDSAIVTTCQGPKLCVFRNAPGYKLVVSLDLPQPYVWDVCILNDEIVAVSVGSYLYFISLRKKSALSRVPTEERVVSFMVLNDGRIAVGCFGGHCTIITPPKSVQSAVDDCVASLYPSSSIPAPHKPPLRAAWLAVQDGVLTLVEACRTAITSDNCAASLEEWSVAHDLLMEAVKRNEIPASRKFDDTNAYWHRVLYQHCAKLAMDEKCIDFMTARFKEAEDAGVIAKGQIESLINTIGIRRDMDADNRFIVNAIYQLLMRQAEMDVRLRQVLHYQRVQQITALVNALIGCIPLGGAIVTNVLSGGASLLKDMDLDGFVESVLGIGKELGGGFVTDRLVDRFLQRTNVVMSVEEWDKVPAEKRKVVEDAASSLGLSLDELREKLLVVAAMQATAEDEAPSEHVLVQEVDEDVTIEPVVSVEYLSKGVASQSVQEVISGVTGPSVDGAFTATVVGETESEMKRWEEKGVCKKVVRPLKSAEAASCFAAYFLNYEEEREVPFPRLKETMTKVFDKKVIYGESFVEANEEEQEGMLDLIVTALSDVTDEDARIMTRMRVRQFIRLASQ